MRIFVLAVLLAGCADGKGFVLVTVDASESLSVDQLRVTATNKGFQKSFDIPAPSAPRDLQSMPMTFSLETSASRSGAIEIVVEGLAGGQTIATGMGSGTISPSAVTRVQITLQRGVAMPDMAMPGDMDLSTAGDMATDGGVGPDMTVINPAPRIETLSPSWGTAGEPGFTVTIKGTGFVSTSSVTFAGAARPVTFVDANTLQFEVLTTAIVNPGRFPVVVTNATPGGGMATAVFAAYVPLASEKWAAASNFTHLSGFFANDTGLRERVWTADLDGDGIEDVVGLANNGDFHWSRGTGSGFAASAVYKADTLFSVMFGWLQNTNTRNVWVGDVTGDGKADLFGVAANGDIYVAESTGTTLKGRMIAGSSPFTFASNYFDANDHEHVYAVDYNKDGKLDILGFRPSDGQIVVVLATGSGTTASFGPATVLLGDSIFNNPNEWFKKTSHSHLLVDDFSGDGVVDVVGLAANGDVHLAEGLTPSPSPSPAPNMKTPHQSGSSIIGDAKGFFDINKHPRVWAADYNGDGKKDILAISSAPGDDGDVLAYESVGSGTDVVFYVRVLLSSSVFKTADGWFDTTSHPRIFITDVNGDGRSDILGVHSSGDVWVSRAAMEPASQNAPAGSLEAPSSRAYFLPAVKNGTSNLTAATFFPTTTYRRVFAADVTGDGVKDLVGIPAMSADGAIWWRMSSPGEIRPMPPVNRGMLVSNSENQMQVKASRRLAPSSVDKEALTVVENGALVVPASVTTTARTATFGVTFPVPAGSDTRLEVGLANYVTDAWGHGLDGDGDGLPGGTTLRHTRWSPTLVAGAARTSLMPADATGIPRKSGFGFCLDTSTPGTATDNPLQARVLVIAGGGSCTTTCGLGQTCVDGQCRWASGIDANLPLVLISVDLVGQNTSRLSQLIASRYGIPHENVILSSTHAHAAFRNVRLLDVPYWDDFTSGTPPYEPWVEDRLADAVGAALRDMTPVEVGIKTQELSLGIDRHAGTVLTAEQKKATAVVLRTPGSPARVRGVLVNYALHPVVMNGANGINADFPGYARMAVEAQLCAANDTGCAMLFLQGGCGDINPSGDVDTDNATVAMAQGMTVASVAMGVGGFTSTANAQALLERRFASFGGWSACNNCIPDPDHTVTPVFWTMSITAVAVGVPGTPLFRFGTIPGEPFSALQKNLMTGLDPAPMMLGYTNGYVGYFPDQNAVTANQNAYGVKLCEGPTYFGPVLGGPNNGDKMVTTLRSMITDDLH